MPKKDPITGCEVMTVGEFFQDEANREGKGRTGGDILNETLSEMDQGYQEEEARWTSKPDELLLRLQEEVKEYNELDPEAEQVSKPISIVEILEVKCSGGMRSSEFSCRVKATKEDGSVGIIKLKSWYTHGTFYDPPDGETVINWEHEAKS